MSTFGERVKILRKQQRMSQDELADKVGMTKQGISKIECGRTKYTNDELIRNFSFYLKCTPDYLLGLTDNPDQNRDNSIDPIRIDPQREIKQKLRDNYIKDSELLELFYKCNEKMNKAELNMLKKFIRALLVDDK